MSENIWVLKLDSRFRCLFPQMALLSNSCLSNCRCLHRDSGAIRGLEIRAQVPIKAGTELSIQYNTLVLGHRKRRQLFRQGQSKECTCWETSFGRKPLKGTVWETQVFAKLWDMHNIHNFFKRVSILSFRLTKQQKLVWFFDCQCVRCCDATEMGSYLNGLVCQECAKLKKKGTKASFPNISFL